VVLYAVVVCPSVHLSFQHKSESCTNHIFGTAEVRVIKFCAQVGYIKSQHTKDKSPLKRAWSGSRDALKILRPQWYLWIGRSWRRRILYTGRLYRISA